jgi:short-subunit dehydrogenase
MARGAARDSRLPRRLRKVNCGYIHCINAGYPRMIQQGFGHLVTMASTAGFGPMPKGVAYATSKHALVGLSRSLRIEAKSHGVNLGALFSHVAG